MKKLMIIVLMALSSSLVFAQAPSRDPSKDPHKPSSAVSAPNHSASADKATKPASAPKPDAGKPSKPGTPAPSGHGGPGSGHGTPGHGAPSGGHGVGPGPGHAAPGHGPGHGYGRPEPRPIPPASARPIPPAGRTVAYYELEETIHYMELLNFDSRKLSYAKEFVRGRALTAAQIERMVREFSFDSNRLSLAKYAYRYCIDPGNYYKVERALTFLSSKEELRSYIARYY